MAGTTLERLLERIRDGEATAAEIARARELASHDGRLPEEIRADLLGEDLQADAVGLLAILGADDFGDTLREALADELDIADEVMSVIEAEGPAVAEAVRSEAGEIEVTADTLRELGDLGLPLREAVLAEAGSVELADAVMDVLGHRGLELSEAVSAEAGEIDIATQVYETLGFASVAIREAVRAEAGETPQIWAAVEDDIRARETLVPEHPVGSFPSAVTPSPVAPSASLPRAANNNRRWMTAAFGALAIAAAVLLVFGLSSDESTIAGLPTPEPVVLVESAELVFASASDVVVENLEYGDDVMVMQMMGDDGAMILWVDEGEVL